MVGLDQGIPTRFDDIDIDTDCPEGSALKGVLEMNSNFRGSLLR